VHKKRFCNNLHALYFDSQLTSVPYYIFPCHCTLPNLPAFCYKTTIIGVKLGIGNAKTVNQRLRCTPKSSQCRNKRIVKGERIPKGQYKMDNPVKLSALGTQDENKQNKNIAQYVLDTTINKQTQITQIRHAPSYKQLEVKTNRTPF
jgi:hypothetical protein